MVTHPTPRNRRKMKRRAAMWRAYKSDSRDAFAIRLVTGESIHEFMKGDGSPAVGALTSPQKENA